jgi:WD40 repeat protein
MFVDSPGSSPPSSAGESTFDQIDPARTVAYVSANEQTDPLPGSRGEQRQGTPKQVGRFRVVSVLGQGTFGTVYRAFDPLLDREVALKVPRFVDDPALYERFLREAKAAARLRHPNIVAVFESGQAAGNPYIASEFVNGVPLSVLLRQQQLPTRTAVDWVRQIAEAVAYAHDEGIVHRDIKPTNIMVNRAGRPQITDFGLAKRAAEEAAYRTIEGQIVGTPAYMSPEQARGETTEIGPHSDQYSVGVVLYEMLCGQTPFTGDAWSVMSRVGNVHVAPPSPRQLCTNLPRDLEACCLKALEKEPTARYPSLRALADDLERWLEGRPLAARPISHSERLVRWCRKNRMIASLAGTLLALIVAIAIVGCILTFQFERLAQIATREAADATRAREKESLAHLATDQLLIDTYTETGLAADRNGDARAAILWFANAAARGEHHALREYRNRVRVHSWLAEVAIPVHAFEPAGGWNRALRYHPSGRYLLCEASGPACETRDLSDGQIVPLPINTPAEVALWSPDGKWLAVAAGREARVFTFPGNQEVDRWTHDDPVTCLAFDGDGKTIAVGGENSARLRNVPARSFVTASLLLEHRARSAALTRDGRRLVLRCADQKVRVVDVSGGDSRIPPQPATAEGKDVAPVFSGDNRLVIVDSGRSVRCWNVTRAEVIWERKWGRCLALAASPDGKWLAVGDNFDAVLLDAATGEQVGKRIVHRNFVHDLAFHPDGSLLLSGSGDQTARISHVPSGAPAVPIIPHNDVVNRCAWSPDGSTFATVHWNEPLVRVWKLGRCGARDFSVPPGTRNAFVEFSADGRHFLACGTDTMRDQRALQVYDARTGAPVGQRLESQGLIGAAAFIAGTSLVVLVGSSALVGEAFDIRRQNLDRAGRVHFLNSISGKAVFTSATTPSEPVAVKTSADGRTIVVLCHRGQVLLFDATTGKQRCAMSAFQGKPADHGYMIRDRIRFSPMGDRFAIWGCGPQVEVRHGIWGELLYEVRHTSNFVHDVRFSPDGQRFVSCSSDMAARLWDTATGTAGTVLPHSGWVFTAQFSGDGKRLLTACSDRHARLWDLDTGKEILATLAQEDEVYAVCFSANEELFFVGTRDGRISAWDVRLGNMVAPVRRGDNMVYQLALAGSGTHVLAAGRLKCVIGFRLDDWIRPPDDRLPREDLRLLGEIVSSQRIHEGGAATSLSRGQWLERWQEFQNRHPAYPLCRMPATR